LKQRRRESREKCNKRNYPSLCRMVHSKQLRFGWAAWGMNGLLSQGQSHLSSAVAICIASAGRVLPHLCHGDGSEHRGP
jgi:hypothetical protein